MTNPDTTRDVPDWLTTGVLRLYDAGCRSMFDPTLGDGRDRILAAVHAFGEACDEHQPTVVPYVTAACTLALAYHAANPTFAAEMVGNPDAFACIDSRTGRPIERIEDHIGPGDLAGQSTLLAMRLVVAAGNNDTGTEHALLMAAEPDVVVGSLVLLAEMVGGAVIDSAREDGTLGPDQLEALASREANELEVPEDAPWGRHIEPDPRDTPEQFETDGRGVYSVGFYRPGRPGNRDATITGLHQVIQQRGDGRALCGVHHDRDVTINEIPYTGRPHVQPVLTAAAEAGQEVRLVQCWQHDGPCPTQGS